MSRACVPTSGTSGCASRKATCFSNRAGADKSSASCRAIEFAARFAQADIQAAREADVFRQTDEPDARIAKRFDLRGAVVGRSVVEDQELEIAPRLREHALDRRAQPASAVVDAHQHRDARRAHGGKHLLEDAPVLRHPPLRIEEPLRSCARGGMSRRPIAHEPHDRFRHSRRVRRGRGLPAQRHIDQLAAVLADQFRHSAAARADHRQPAGERFDHDRRAGVVILRMQQQMRVAVRARPLPPA